MFVHWQPRRHGPDFHLREAQFICDSGVSVFLACKSYPATQKWHWLSEWWGMLIFFSQVDVNFCKLRKHRPAHLTFSGDQSHHPKSRTVCNFVYYRRCVKLHELGFQSLNSIELWSDPKSEFSGTKSLDPDPWESQICLLGGTMQPDEHAHISKGKSFFSECNGMYSLYMLPPCPSWPCHGKHIDIHIIA